MWIGMLAAVAVSLIIGLIGLAVGAQEISRFVDWKKVGLTALAFNVVGAFFAFVIGAWAAARVAGIRRSEPAILHGAIVWLLALPVLLLHPKSPGRCAIPPWPPSSPSSSGLSEP
jgi:uncharacterized membrane protein